MNKYVFNYIKSPFLLLFFLGFIILSCKRNSIEENYNGHLLTGKEFSISSNSLGYPRSMVIYDSILILSDAFNDHVFKCINLNQQIIFREFGRLGMGPQEFSKFSILNKHCGKGRDLGIHDKRRFLYHAINLDSIINNPNYVFHSYGPFDSNARWLVKGANEIFVGTGYFEKRYSLFNREGLQTNLLYTIPFQKDLNLSVDDLYMANQGALKVKPDGKKLIVANAFSPNFEIVEILNNDLKKVFESNTSPPKIVSKSNNNITSIEYKTSNINGFNDVAVNDNFIYLLYSGRSVESHGEKSNGSNVVFQYDWQGNKISTYILDRDVNFLVVDDKDEILYSVSFEPEPKIIYYDLRVEDINQ